MARHLRDVDEAVSWLRGQGCGRPRSHSRLVQTGDTFIAWPGRTHDARSFVGQALAQGAAACLVEAQGVQAFGWDDARVAALSGLQAAAGEVASRMLGVPSRSLQVLAVTGTNGKTSTTWWYAQALRALGRRCAVVGTLGAGEPPLAAADPTYADPTYADPTDADPTDADPTDADPTDADPSAHAGWTPTGLTTPDPVVLQQALADFVQQGLYACALEASSIGLQEGRLAGTRIDIAVFTNFTRDHLDYHQTMQAYWAAKRRLFDWPGLRTAVVNIDDPMGERLAAELQATRMACWTVSARGEARLTAHRARSQDGTLAFELREAGESAGVRTALVGDFNVYNLLCVAAALRASGVPLAEVAAALQGVGPVPGRLQRVSAGAAPGPDTAAPEIVIDYAHTPDALEKVLQTLRPVAAARGGELWCVFGCGGDRDATKRPLMGAIAARLAHHTVLTSDNPRSEDPQTIIDQVLAGMPADAAAGHTRRCVPDRRAAIDAAVSQAAAADVVLVAGKGHEAWQEVGKQRLPFSDAVQARRALAQRARHQPLAGVAA